MYKGPIATTKATNGGGSCKSSNRTLDAMCSGKPDKSCRAGWNSTAYYWVVHERLDC